MFLKCVEKENHYNVNEVHTIAKWLFDYFRKCVHETEKNKKFLIENLKSA